MARLHPAAAGPAAADRHLVAADLGLLGCGQVLLVLAGDPLQAKLAATPRAPRRQPDTDHPVDPTGHRPPRMPPVRLAGLAARPSGAGGGPVLGERRGLALARPPQLLDLGDQVPDPGSEPLVVCRQPLDLTDQPVTLDPHRLALGLHHHDPLAQPGHGLALLVGAPALRPVIAARTIHPDQQDQGHAIPIPFREATANCRSRRRRTGGWPSHSTSWPWRSGPGRSRGFSMPWFGATQHCRPGPSANSPPGSARRPAALGLTSGNAARRDGWACQDLNLGPHPYQLTAGNRCADGRSCRSRATGECLPLAGTHRRTLQSSPGGRTVVEPAAPRTCQPLLPDR